MAELSPTTYRVVLVPVTHTTTDGCYPGTVKLTGTPGEGEWETWGPYQCVGEITLEPVVGVPPREPGPGGGGGRTLGGITLT